MQENKMQETKMHENKVNAAITSAGAKLWVDLQCMCTSGFDSNIP
jgi:hypothetical protein